MRKVIIMIVSAALGAVGLVGGAGTALATGGGTALATGGGTAHATGGGTAHATGGGTVITVANTPFGEALVVGSGTYKGYSLYDITSDQPPSYGCTTTPVSLPGLPPGLTCTGPSNDTKAEWPAITTDGAPVAGPGVNASLLGSVFRKGIGRQITYNGMPLYLFDEHPHVVTGQGFDEPGIPPWHGIWFLVKPDGNQLPWISNLTTVKLNGHRYLATPMETGVGWINFPVYTRDSACRPGSCAMAWPYMLTAGHPGTSDRVDACAVGTRWTGLGMQVTYKDHPLYLFSNEALNPTTLTAAGNGNGVAGFSLVSP
jgi:predicted lipoprotein with Yx(FWY)xxD motif